MGASGSKGGSGSATALADQARLQARNLQFLDRMGDSPMKGARIARMLAKHRAQLQRLKRENATKNRQIGRRSKVLQNKIAALQKQLRNEKDFSQGRKKMIQSKTTHMERLQRRGAAAAQRRANRMRTSVAGA